MKRARSGCIASLAARVAPFAFSAFAACAAVGATTGCGSSAEPAFYALSTIPGQATRGNAPRVVEIRRPGIAGYLDRADIVARISNYRVRTKDGERWGEPFGDMIGRVLAADLSLRLSGSTVFREEAALTADADARVEIDVQRFDAGDDGDVVLLAQVAVVREKPTRTSATRSVTLHVRPNGTGTPELVGAMSTLLGQLADQVATMLRQDPTAVAREP